MNPSIVVLTGAGVSQESGIATFRDANGLWEKHSVEEVASPEGFSKNPFLVHSFYNLRRAQLKAVEPNAAHLALAKLERRWPGEFLLITQNVDDLHCRAGSQKLISMHGELRKARCTDCRWVGPWEDDLRQDSTCPACNKVAFLRPHIVWFGEVPLGLDECFRAIEHCDLFLCIGTSGNVYPAAGFVEAVPRQARRIECNARATQISRAFTERRLGPAGVVVPKLVEELLEEI